VFIITKELGKYMYYNQLFVDEEYGAGSTNGCFGVAMVNWSTEKVWIPWLLPNIAIVYRKQNVLSIGFVEIKPWTPSVPVKKEVIRDSHVQKRHWNSGIQCYNIISSTHFAGKLPPS
jgi:hypothetical protein